MKLVRMFAVSHFTAAACCLFLSGCFDVKEDFVFTGDGNASVELRFAIDAALIAMAEKNQSKPWCGDDAASKGGVDASVSKTTEGGDIVCTIRMTGTAEAVIAALSESDNVPGGNQTQQGLTLSREGDRYQLAIHIPSMKPADTSEDDNPMAQSMEALLLAKMSGRAISFSVMAPTIIETTGKLSDDHKVATYSRPLAEAYSSGEPTDFRTIFSLEGPGLIDRITGFFK